MPRRIPVAPIPPVIRPDDPAGASPLRGHRFLARWSRHKVPTTPGKKPQERYTTPPGCRTGSLSIEVRRPSGVVGYFLPIHPGVFGATPLDIRAKRRAPLTGCLAARSACLSLIDRLSDHADTLSGHPACRSHRGKAPDIPPVRSRRGAAPEGSPPFSPGVEARSADDPGKWSIFIIDPTPPGVALVAYPPFRSR